eukprot:4767966-Amphidinium_carterae.1
MAGSPEHRKQQTLDSGPGYVYVYVALARTALTWLPSCWSLVNLCHVAVHDAHVKNFGGVDHVGTSTGALVNVRNMAGLEVWHIGNNANTRDRSYMPLLVRLSHFREHLPCKYEQQEAMSLAMEQ